MNADYREMIRVADNTEVVIIPKKQYDLMKSTIEAVEWVQFDGMEFAVCPSCSCLEDEGHSFGCLLKHALGKEN